jgi:hypothetical protein
VRGCRSQGYILRANSLRQGIRLFYTNMHENIMVNYCNLPCCGCCCCCCCCCCYYHHHHHHRWWPTKYRCPRSQGPRLAAEASTLVAYNSLDAGCGQGCPRPVSACIVVIEAVDWLSPRHLGSLASSYTLSPGQRESLCVRQGNQLHQIKSGPASQKQLWWAACDKDIPDKVLCVGRILGPRRDTWVHCMLRDETFP